VERRPLAVFALRQVRRATGAVRNVLEQAEYAREMGYTVRICSERVDRTRLASRELQWVPILRLPVKGYIRRIFYDWSVQRYIHRAQPDLFISHGDARSHDILVIHNCFALAHERLHGNPARGHEQVRFQERIIRESRCRFLIANSELMKRDLIERYELDASKVGVFYQGVDTTLFNVRNQDALRRQGRKTLRLPDRAFVAGLITSGAFHKRNVRFFLEVAAGVREHLPEAHFLIAGKDSSIRWYQNYAKQLGLENSVVFASPVKDVWRYYHALDAFVYPAKIEEYGRVVLEALACGIPSIIGAAVGASELMEIENVPTILKGWDKSHWVQQIISIAEQPNKASAHASAGIAMAEKYSQPKRSRAMKELLTELKKA
jgi:UDP-glucose:(heptosyl)LPS alpha-1,3-glucosyltransferase